MPRNWQAFHWHAPQSSLHALCLHIQPAMKPTNNPDLHIQDRTKASKEAKESGESVPVCFSCGQVVGVSGNVNKAKCEHCGEQSIIIVKDLGDYHKFQGKVTCNICDPFNFLKNLGTHAISAFSYIIVKQKQGGICEAGKILTPDQLKKLNITKTQNIYLS